MAENDDLQRVVDAVWQAIQRNNGQGLPASEWSSTPFQRGKGDKGASTRSGRNFGSAKKSVRSGASFARRSANDRNRADSFLPRERARSGAKAPGAAERGPSFLDEIDMLLSQSGGGFTPLPMPDRGAFMRPFDQAEAAARTVYDQAMPRIGNNYSVLDADLAASAADYDARMAAIEQAVNREQQQTTGRTDAAAAAANTALASQGGGASSLAQELAASTAAQQGAQAQVQGATDEILARIQGIGQEGSRSVQAQADSTEAAAKTDAEMALAQVLNQIGLKRSDAESQYAAQAADIAARNQAAEQESRSLALEEAIQMRELYDQEQADIYAQAADEGWQINAQRRMANHPESWDIVSSVIKEAGSSRDPQTYTVAQQVLQDLVGEVGLGNASRIEDLDEWLRQYYGMSTKGVDQGVFSRLGGDGDWLRRYLGG